LNQSMQGISNELSAGFGGGELAGPEPTPLTTPVPEYRHPKKRWRLKRSAVPAWYKNRTRMRTHTQSGAARVARFRPAGLKK